MPLVSRLSLSRVSRLASLALALLFASSASAAANDLDVARQALRDGFWSLARAHASESARTSEEGRLIVLESWAREKQWDEILRALDSWGNPAGEAYAYWRAYALAMKGEVRAAREVFAGGLPTQGVYLRLATRLLAGLALEAGDLGEAERLLAANPEPEPEDRLLLAEVRKRPGREREAAALWREVLTATNAPIRAVATSAVNLEDIARLRILATNEVSAEVRALVRLRLGVLLLSTPDSFEEGAKMIREIVTTSPDVEGADIAARKLAGARLRRGDWPGAATGYREILEIWPAAARIESVQEGLGWALLKQGRAEEALTAFLQAEACAATDDDRAAAAAKTADALAALGRTDESAAKCREVVEKWPRTAVANRLSDVLRLRELESRGRTLYREFRFAEAQKLFHEVAAGDVLRRGRMTFFEALCLYGQGRDAEAEACARALLAETSDPKLRADVTQWLARAAYNAGRWREARDLFVAFAAFPSADAKGAAEARVWAARAALAANDFSAAIALATEVVAGEADPVSTADALVAQGEALLELARFDEAALVFERAAKADGTPPATRLAAQILRADALYAVGADNPARYEEALNAYRAISQSESVPEGARLALAYKIGVTLEKLRSKAEAIDQYYTHVILAYRETRRAGRPSDDEAGAVFARAAFRLADLCEADGHFLQAQKTLELVAESDVPAAAEARKRLERISKKGIEP